MVKKKTIIIPEKIVIEAKMLLSNHSYKNSKCCRDIVRKLIGTCNCGEVASKFTIEQRDGIQVIEHYCDQHH